MSRLHRSLSIIFLLLFLSLPNPSSSESPAFDFGSLSSKLLFSQSYAGAWAICCLFMVELLDLDPYVVGKRVDTEPRRSDLLHLSINDRNTGSPDPKCEQITRVKLTEMNDAEYLSFVILFRTCETISNRNGFFFAHYYGSLPYYELVPSEKYRISFYTRLSDFPVAAHESMISPEKTYLKLVITVNRNPRFLDESSESQVLATLDCDGSWRTFHETPEHVSEIFQFQVHEFSLAQNDQCEEFIMNDLRLTPKIGEKIN